MLGESAGREEDDGAAPGDRKLRTDAERNRELILAAAARLFAERGTDVGFREIAREAGVGVGTVYRRFPDRTSLIEALITARYEPILALCARHLEQDRDPAELLKEFCLELVNEASSDVGLRQTLFHLADNRATEELHLRIADLFATVTSRAHEAGLLRREVTAEDVALLTIALSGLRGVTAGHVARYIALFLEGAYAPSVPRQRLEGRAPTVQEARAIFNAS